MAEIVGPNEIVGALLLVKAVLAILAVVLFLHYKLHWDKVKRHLPINFFYTKWRAVRHAVALGIAAIGFAIGFSLEIFGAALGLSPGFARWLSTLFEIGSLFSMLYVFFTLALDDVPHFQHIAEAARHHRRLPAQEASSRAAARLSHRHDAHEVRIISESKHAEKPRGRRRRKRRQ